VNPVTIERGVIGALPYAAVGSGPALVVCPGLWPVTGVAGDGFVRGALAPVRGLEPRRRLVVINRRAHLPAGLTMRDLAAEYASAITSCLDAPVDIIGSSTGGSIAQQLAADHPEAVRRLVLLSTACRLGPLARDLQGGVAKQLRTGQTRKAASLAATGLVPSGLRTLGRGLGWVLASRAIPTALEAADLAATIEAEDGFDLAACERPIQARTLIIGGGRDRFYETELFRETAALIPLSQLRIFPRRGHVSVTSDRRARAAIAGFLTAPESASDS
jgi:pimeloyl-ACP methyl ester carboxylesterase